MTNARDDVPDLRVCPADDAIYGKVPDVSVGWDGEKKPAVLRLELAGLKQCLKGNIHVTNARDGACNGHKDSATL
jgi:hypothetical protein